MDVTLWGRAAAVWRGRRGTFFAIAAIVASFALGAASIVGWRYYAESKFGRVELLTEGKPVVAQVLDEPGDSPIGEPFDLATRAVVLLPEGDYQLRVNGVGRIGRTYRFAVNRGETQAHTISIDEGRLLGGEQAPIFGGGARGWPAPIRFAHVLARGRSWRGRRTSLNSNGNP